MHVACLCTLYVSVAYLNVNIISLHVAIHSYICALSYFSTLNWRWIFFKSIQNATVVTDLHRRLDYIHDYKGSNRRRRLAGGIFPSDHAPSCGWNEQMNHARYCKVGGETQVLKRKVVRYLHSRLCLKLVKGDLS
jgi:hypothetical protein